MGNKIGTLLSRRRKQRKPETIRSTAISHETLCDREDEVYFTPKACQSEPEDQENTDDAKNLEAEHSLDSENCGPNFICEICAQPRALDHLFNLKGCTHFYCTECTIRYIISKLDDNRVCISCPVSDCKGVLEPEYCRDILPNDVFGRWGFALCESVIDGSEKFYCPYVDCSTLLINDGGEEIDNSVCPCCKRAFCVKCRVPWHSDIDCKKFQKLKKRGDDRLLADLAKRKKWRKCPKCKYYVEKTAGCFYIKCRCGHAFCYNCGARSSISSHMCRKCRR